MVNQGELLHHEAKPAVAVRVSNPKPPDHVE